MGLLSDSFSEQCKSWVCEGFFRTLQFLAFSPELLKTKSHRSILLRAPERCPTSPREQEQLCFTEQTLYDFITKIRNLKPDTPHNILS